MITEVMMLEIISKMNTEIPEHRKLDGWKVNSSDHQVELQVTLQYLDSKYLLVINNPLKTYNAITVSSCYFLDTLIKYLIDNHELMEYSARIREIFGPALDRLMWKVEEGANPGRLDFYFIHNSGNYFEIQTLDKTVYMEQYVYEEIEDMRSYDINTLVMIFKHLESLGYTMDRRTKGLANMYDWMIWESWVDEE